MCNQVCFDITGRFNNAEAQLELFNLIGGVAVFTTTCEDNVNFIDSSVDLAFDSDPLNSTRRQAKDQRRLSRARQAASAAYTQHNHPEYAKSLDNLH